MIRTDNVSQSQYENKVPLDSNQVADASEDSAADKAVPNANAIKAQGSHILAIAVGDGLDSNSSLNRLKKVSGPDVFDGTGTFDISTTDVYREPDFSKLKDALREAAFQLCAPSVTIRKMVDLTPDTGVRTPSQAPASTSVRWSPPHRSPGPCRLAVLATPRPTPPTATASPASSGIRTTRWHQTPPSPSRTRLR